MADLTERPAGSALLAHDAEPVRPAAAPVDVSILIVTWNSARWVERCLRSIPAACEGLSYEIIVHDNHSQDATVQLLTGAEVIRSERNAGFAAGINAASRRARGHYLFLLNPDCELSAGALTRLLQFLEAHGGAAAAAPLLESDNGDSQRDFQLRRLPTLSSFAWEVLMLNKIFPRNPATDRYRYRDLDLGEPRRIEQPAGAALLLRRSAAEDVGPLDEQFAPAWFEDVDYCRRLAAKGHEIWVVPSSQVRHYGGASLEHMPLSDFARIWYRNMWLYTRKWLGAPKAEVLRWMIIAGMGLRILAGFFGRLPRGTRSRREAFRAWSGVAKEAWARWSPSSS
jgi:GT2 family glycosyltransferase